MTSVSSTSTAASLLSSAVSTSTSSTTTSTSVDWDTLIEAGYQAKLAQATAIDTKITANEAKISAYEELQSLLQDVADAAEALRAPSGSTAAASDAFKARSAYLTANGDVNASDVLGISAESDAALDSYEVTISQIATAEKVASDVVTSRSSDLGYDGVFSLAAADGTAVSIAVDSGMTLDEIAEAINDTTDTSNVQASVIKVADSQYKLVVTASNTGQAITAGFVSGTDVLYALGLTSTESTTAGATTTTFKNQLQAAQDAVFTLDGVTITRSSNDVDDLVDGVTFYLYGVTPDDASVTAEISSDLTEIEDDVQALVDAYNAFREYALTQQETSTDGTASSDAVLFGDGTLRNITSSIADALTSAVGSDTMALLGLSFDSDNTLVLDTDMLEDALLDDLDSVEALLTFQFTPSSSDLKLLARGTSVPASFTLDVTVDSSGTLTAVSVGGDSSLFTVNGSLITGNAGTAYEGLSLVYTGSTSQSISVTTSTGLAEALYQIADTAADTSDGTLQTQIDTLEDKDDDLQTRSDDLTSKAETYKETLTTRYSKYQAAIEEAQSMLTYLEALLNSDSD